MNLYYDSSRENTEKQGILFSSRPSILRILMIVLLSLMLRSSLAQSTVHLSGEDLYLTRCGACHQADGEGISGIFPPVNQVDWVTGDKGRLIRIVLDGAVGEFAVSGVVYNSVMPPWRSSLNDQEMAALLTYIRAAWGNSSSEITEAEVLLVRTATSDKAQAWTAQELSEESNQGIPDLQLE